MAALEEMSPSTRVLARGEVISLDAAGRECRVACVSGRLWVTATGQSADTVLTAGQEASWIGCGRIVVEALRTATVRVQAGAPARHGLLLLAAQPAR